MVIDSERSSVSDEPKLTALVKRIGERAGMVVTTSKGWDSIIADADAGLAELDPIYVVAQVKEKFGGLAFYYRPSTSDPDIRAAMQSIVNEAVTKAAYTCEISGRDDGVLGHWQGRNWLRTLSISLYGPEGFEPLPPED